jgi:5-methylcytosine-specific restriction endonuclease McrA
MTYSEKLKDPRWQKKRLQILERDGWTCQDCWTTSKTLHVHHKFYIPNTEPWDYDNAALVTKCETCHEKGGAETRVTDAFFSILRELIEKERRCGTI